jgi:hypothetical protein
MIKRYDIRPRRKRQSNGADAPEPAAAPPAPDPQRAAPSVVGPLTPAGIFEDK